MRKLVCGSTRHSPSRLSAGTATAMQVTERIVEVPFAMAALSRLEPGARILDIGSAESTFPLSAASLGYRCHGD